MDHQLAIVSISTAAPRGSDGDRRASWLRSGKVSGVHFVHLGESQNVGEIHIHFHHIGERFVRGTQNQREVAKDLFCLRGHAAVDQFSRGRVLRDLAARVDLIAIANSW